MTPEQIETLKDVLGDVRHLSEVAKDAPQPVQAILKSQIFLIVQKLRFVLGETE